MKMKCTFTPNDLSRIVDILEDRISQINTKIRNPLELTEMMVYRLHAMIALNMKFQRKLIMVHPADKLTCTFDLKDVLTLKYCLMDHLTTPGLRDIFTRLDRHIHPAIQLEL